MDIKLSEDQNQLIDKIATTEGLKNYSVHFNQGSLKGDGLTGQITLVEIRDKSQKKVLHLVLKTAHQNDFLRNQMQIDRYYKRENFLYCVIFNDFRELQKAFNVREQFLGTARYYGGLTKKKQECIILENLKEIGFKMWDRKSPMDHHHVGAVMAHYGKVHALSYAMKQLKPETFEDRSKSLFHVSDEKMTDGEIKKTVPVVLGYVYKVFKDNYKVTCAIKRFEDTSLEFLSKVIRTRDKYSVILHGDCWGNNIIFKYENEDTQKPSKVCLLDWQMSSLGSPLLDLANFFYISGSQDCLNNYEKYLKIYHDSLSEMLQRFEILSKNIITLEELKAEWKKYAKFGMYLAISLIKVMLTEREEMPDLKEIESVKLLNFLTCDISNSDEYKRRLGIIIDHMADNDFV